MRHRYLSRGRYAGPVYRTGRLGVSSACGTKLVSSVQMLPA
ncbi:hypothetical protein JOC37_000894 [Desulfohalotomaculum tongense]|nr:hypothetical protein [Desulforadius tongensis]MBM7854521.1 hypothetical protein [Desulforadius tongensis]